MRLLRLLQSARSAPEANFPRTASKVPKQLHCRSKLKISKTAWFPRVQIPKPLFGRANLPKAQNSSKFSVSQNPKGGLWLAAVRAVITQMVWPSKLNDEVAWRSTGASRTNFMKYKRRILTVAMKEG